ncbi:hypothetical protein AK812_SmicGene18364 [Symbiodinium microadriaticum]|uniref:Uncharacterized protein n=1 Tax=Symbiodinium microadriaticum TaxID=2951 RepID=A0A1Q9DV81_SYMMI|nr:hypothetical protein AK812_SmicGene18364 [Symbiodinium microadriaticum]
MVARRFFLDQRRGANLTEQALLELQLDTFTYQSLLAFANRVEYILNSIPVDHQPSEQTKFTWLFSRLKKCRLLQRHIDRIKDAHEGSRVRTWDWLFSKLKDLIAELREDANETAIKDALSPSSNKPNNPPKTKEQREKDRRNREKGPNCPFAHVGPGGKAPKAGAATKVDPGEGHADSEREEEIPAAKTARLIKESRYIAATGGEFPGRMLLLGQLVYYRTDPKHREKFEPSAAPALFCGYRFDSGPESFKGVYLVLDYRKVKAGTAGSDLAVSVPFEELYVPEGEEIFPMRAAFERALEGFTEPKFPDIKGLEVPFSPLSPDSTPAKRHEYITLDRIIKYGITPGCKACKGDAVIHSPVCKVRFDGLVRADKAAEARIKSLPPTPVSIPPTPLPPAPPSADPTADPAPDALDEGRDDDRGGLGAMVNKEIFVPDDEFLARDRQFRRSKAPGNNQLVEYCCSDDSEVGFTGDMYGVDCLSIGMSSIDFANPDHVDQAKGAHFLLRLQRRGDSLDHPISKGLIRHLPTEIFGLPPGQVPALANKYFCVSARLSQEEEEEQEGPKQKARPRPRTEIATVRFDESSADLGAELARGCTLDVGLVLSLDFNGVINRDFASTVRLFRSLATRRDVYLLICSKCSTESLIGPAVDFIRGALREAQYLIRRVPLFFCSRAVRRGGKAEKLYEALRAAGLHNLPLWHADDRRDICLEVDRWDGWHAIEVSFRDRRGLDQIVAEAIGL